MQRSIASTGSPGDRIRRWLFENCAPLTRGWPATGSNEAAPLGDGRSPFWLRRLVAKKMQRHLDRGGASHLAPSNLGDCRTAGRFSRPGRRWPGVIWHRRRGHSPEPTTIRPSRPRSPRLLRWPAQRLLPGSSAHGPTLPHRVAIEDPVGAAPRCTCLPPPISPINRSKPFSASRQESPSNSLQPIRRLQVAEILRLNHVLGRRRPHSVAS